MVPDDVWNSARAEYHCVLGTIQRDQVMPIRSGSRIVGFCYPHDSPIGRRIAQLFVLPEFRGRGLALAVYARLRGPLVACIRDDNPASIRLHEKAGFVRWHRYAAGWWWKRV